MIDDEIRNALNVDPAQEFVAHVRARIANEPEPSAWRWSYVPAAVAVLAAAIAIAVVVPRRAPHVAIAPAYHDAGLKPRATTVQPRATTPDAPVAQGFSPAVPLEPDHSGAAVARPDRSAKAVALPEPGAIARHDDQDEPVILIDLREQRALRQLIAGVREGRVDLAAAQNSTTTTPADLEPVTDIVIAPLTIEPLAPLAGAEGARQ
jgi:hypothetical protein